MTRIVPEQIVETIDRLFIGELKGAGTAALTDERVYHLRAIVLLVHQLPSVKTTSLGTDVAFRRAGSSVQPFGK